jgi:predicted lipase
VTELSKLWKTNKFKSILVTGHSRYSYISVYNKNRGGALAELCSLDLVLLGYPKNSVELYTYGKPRVGNQAFANYMKVVILNI